MKLSHMVLKIIAVTITSLSMTGVVSAVTMTGGVGLSGNYTPVDINGNPSGGDLLNAAGFDIGNAVVGTASGSFDAEGLAFGDAVNHNDFYFSPASTPVTPLWTTTTGTTGQFSFDLLTLAIDVHNSTQVNLSGTGLLHHPGFDDTQGTWTFTANSLGSGTFTWSSSNVVPEPSVLVLLGLGLLGLASGRRMSKA